MRIIILFLLFGASATVFAQDLQKIELKLSEAVSDWQKVASDLDLNTIKLNDLTQEFEEAIQASEWLEHDLENWQKVGDVAEVKRTQKAYKQGKKRIKKLSKKLSTVRKKLTYLENLAESKKVDMNRLSFEKESILNADDYNGNVVFSGYFPKADEFYSPRTSDDLLYYPPDFPCESVFDGMDPYRKKHRVDMASTVFFTNHPEGLTLYDNKPQLVCRSSMSLVEGGTFSLNLSFKIHTDNARKAYGYLERKSRVVITFLNGDELVLLNNVLNLGKFDREKGVAVFRGMYPLSVYDQGKLKKYSIDKVLVEWAKGYEIYEVFDVDLLKNQLECL